VLPATVHGDKLTERCPLLASAPVCGVPGSRGDPQPSRHSDRLASTALSPSPTPTPRNDRKTPHRAGRRSQYDAAPITVGPSIRLHGSPKGPTVDGKMNSLNILSAKVSPPPSPGPSRSNSLSSIGLALAPEDGPRRKETVDAASRGGDTSSAEPQTAFPDRSLDDETTVDENTPLISHLDTKGIGTRPWHYIPKRVATAVLNSLRWVLSTLAAPGVYLIAYLYDENGNFAPLLQLKRLFGLQRGNGPKLSAEAYQAASMDEKADPGLDSRGGNGRAFALAPRPAVGTGSSSSGLSSESDSELDRQAENNASAGSSQGRSRTAKNSEEIAPARRSIRIKLHNDDATRQRKQRKDQSGGGGRTEGEARDISAQLKSPTSPVGALTKYPKMPGPPRPLIPRRQPSYLNMEPTDKAHQKTLILDLDETLIHSMSKGGRMSSGHMVEVRLNTTYVGASGQASVSPQHPILYYVHKRPYCDDFLRRVRDAIAEAKHGVAR